ncbi:MAG: DEAD/DEAH box helicase [Anaerolineae bacterium]
MILLHGAWLPGEPGDKHRGFVVWAEATQVGPPSRWTGKPIAGPRVAPEHPLAVPRRPLRRAVLDLMPAAEHLLRMAEDQSIVVWLPSASEDAPQTSPELALAETTSTEGLTLRPWQVDAFCLDPFETPVFLVALPGAEDDTPGIKVGADLVYWGAANRLVLELLARQRYHPTLTARSGHLRVHRDRQSKIIDNHDENAPVEKDDKFLALWQPLLDEPEDQKHFARLVAAMPALCRAVERADSSRPMDEPPVGESPRVLLDNFVQSTVDGFLRWNSDVSGDTLKSAYSKSTTTIAEAWLDALNSDNPEVKGSTADLRALYDQYRVWTEPFPGAAGGDTFRLCFRLEPPEATAATGIVMPRRDRRDWTLRYLLQAADDPSLLVPAEAVWRERGSTFKYLNRKFESPQERLLAGLGQASRLFAPIDQSLHSPRPELAELTVDEAYTFINETSLLLQSYGFGVLLPGVNNKLAVHVRLRPKQDESPKGGVPGLSFQSIIQYDWQLALGDQPLTRAEFDRLAALKVPLVQIRGQWVEVKPEQIQQALKFWEKRKGAGEFSLQEAMRLALSLQPGQSEGGLPVAAVETEGWMNDLVQQLSHGDRIQPVLVPGGFNGSLRRYQEAGLAWLAFLRQWGLGACLADDMGLGKTVQVAALLLHEHESGQNGRPALVVCPTSVVSNWQRELARFAPSLKVLAHHGAARKKTDFAAEAPNYDVVISSYALLHRDQKELTGVEWGDVILDEAQNIKNPSTKQAQAARKLPAQWRTALTGTPVENRLAELWSIMQFLNPGYLGSQEDFRKRLANPIERANDPDATQRLKSLVSPFILRRVKTDPTVISDLPLKNEMKVYCNLTKEQATLYEAVVRDSLRRIQESAGIERRGIVLATLMRLKQVCNHPAQFLADGSALPGRSGKLARLTEMLEEVRTVNERALIFTQFAEMGKMLQAYLQEAFGHEVLLLYGGTPTKQRTAMIERFQNDPHGPLAFILSIKAGGTGLNLTRANHVFHFDRWWNPAVENQATDRAFRIGQIKNVQVYKYLCAGTFEDKIDEMIERKKGLAASIIGASEQWITELSTDQLRDLFALQRQAVGDA